MATGKRCSLVLLLTLLFAGPGYSEVCATDDRGQQVCLENPAQRIAALSPGATELVWAAGAGDKVVAVVAFSDYPPAARDVVSVGSHVRLDVERLLSLKPDLIIGWETGNPREQMALLESFGLPVFTIEPRRFDDVASVLRRLGRLAGTSRVADAEATRFLAGIESLREKYSDRSPVDVFYEVWHQPLMTVSDDHLIGKVLTLCGGRNVFGTLPTLVPKLDTEAVLVADPEVILTSGIADENREWFEHWQKFDGLRAARLGNLLLVPPSLIQRPTPRLLEGSQILCEKLESVRQRRAASSSAGGSGGDSTSRQSTLSPQGITES